MDDAERTRLLDLIARTIGDTDFNELVRSVKETRGCSRLRFWQEDLLRTAGVPISNVADFVDLFEKAKWRATGRSKDALAAATTTFWEPILREHGFKKHGKRSFARVTNDCVFQYIGPELSAYGGKDFKVCYVSMILTRLNEHVGTPTFRHLPAGKSHVGSWSARTQEFADQAMPEICERTRNTALPWFESTSTPLGLACELVNQAENGNAHTFFELGCCYATSGDLAAAIGPLAEAIRRFQKELDENQACTWALKERDLAQELAAAIANGTHASLLSRWRTQTIANLKLSKILDRPIGG